MFFTFVPCLIGFGIPLTGKSCTMTRSSPVSNSFPRLSRTINFPAASISSSVNSFPHSEQPKLVSDNS